MSTVVAAIPITVMPAAAGIQIRHARKLTLGITPVILTIMKTAISIPDPVFEAAEKLAQQLGVSRSELYSTAILTFVESHRDDYVTEQLNEIYSTEDSSLDPLIRQLHAMSLPIESW